MMLQTMVWNELIFSSSIHQIEVCHQQVEKVFGPAEGGPEQQHLELELRFLRPSSYS